MDMRMQERDGKLYATPTTTVRQLDPGSSKRRRIILKLVWRAVLTKNPVVMEPAPGTNGSIPLRYGGESASFSLCVFQACRRSSGRCNWLCSRMKYQRRCVKR